MHQYIIIKWTMRNIFFEKFKVQTYLLMAFLDGHLLQFLEPTPLDLEAFKIT